MSDPSYKDATFLDVVEAKRCDFSDNFCSAGLHYAKFTVCVFRDPGECEVFVCADCMRHCIGMIDRAAASAD
jgi:hypothetical protein